jgi:hypothetical protein
VLGLLLAWRFGSKPVPAIRKQAAALRVSDESMAFPVVLNPTDEYRAFLRKQAWALGAAIVISFGMLVAIAVMGLGRAKPASQLAQIALMAAMAAVIVWYFAREILQPKQLRITASRAGLFRSGKCIGEAPLADIYVSDRMLLLGKTRIAYQMAQGGRKVPPKYDVELLERALIHRLPEDHLIDDLALNKKVIGLQPLWLKVLLAVAAVGFFVWMFKDMLPV